MNQDNDKSQATEFDPQVSDQYESLASEKTPAQLDQAVLREAKRAVRADNRKGSFGAWFRPVAFMTMVGLSLAIILDLSNTEINKPVSDLSFETAPAGQAPPGRAADSEVRNLGQPAISEIKRQEKLAPAAASTADAPNTNRDNATSTTPQAVTGNSALADQGQMQKMRRDAAPAIALPAAEPVEEQGRVSDALSLEAGLVEERVQQLEATVDGNRQSQPGDVALFAVTPKTESLVAPVACSDGQKTNADEWWKCIATLRQSGLAELADLELENLQKEFPDFTAPD